MTLQPWPSQVPLRQSHQPLKSVQLRIEDCQEELKLSVDKPILLGRDASCADCWAIDLNEFGAQEKGVSYHHARLVKHLDGLMVVDSGSLNGTFLNAQRLTPHTPHEINHGDYLHLGLLMVKISLA